jgi:hypothetical protein
VQFIDGLKQQGKEFKFSFRIFFCSAPSGAMAVHHIRRGGAFRGVRKRKKKCCGFEKATTIIAILFSDRSLFDSEQLFFLFQMKQKI